MTLHLLPVSFSDGGSARRLFQSCPMLKDLFLRCCCTEDIQVLEISVPGLRTLKIHGYEDHYKLVLNVPNVEYFEYGGNVVHRFSSVQGFKSLAKAFISFQTFSNEGYEALQMLVNTVSHVRHRCLCAFILKAFKRSSRTLSIFRNLTHLEIRVFSSFDSPYVLDILDRTPHLAVLVIDSGWCPEEEYDVDQRSHLLPEDMPPCVSLQLKEVQFLVFLMLEYEHELVEYFLKNAKFLDTLKIQFKDSLENQYKVRKKLLTFARCLRTCRIRHGRVMKLFPSLI